jgi:hypothetical protein
MQVEYLFILLAPTFEPKTQLFQLLEKKACPEK